MMMANGNSVRRLGKEPLRPSYSSKKDAKKLYCVSVKKSPHKFYG